MKQETRTNQGGSVVTFAIIGAILVVLLAGGIYYAYQRGTNIRSGEPLIGSTEHKTPDPTPSESSDNTDSSTQSETSNRTNEQSGESQQSTPSTDSTSDSGASSTTNEIPQTGPADTIYTLVGLALVVFSVMRYVRSRVSLRTL